MRIIPGLYIQRGKVVSLYKGTENEEKKVYPKAPHNYAELWEREGAKTLFVVDLDGTERKRAAEIRQHFSGDLWWGGAVRTMEAVKELFDAGVNRVVLGAKAEPIFAEALALYGADRLIAGIQAFTTDEIPDLCQRRVEQGFHDIIVKDMNADGTLFHPNFDLMEKCAYFSDAVLYSAGGVSEEHHLELLRQAGVEGVIIARALYEQRLSLPALLHRFERA